MVVVVDLRACRPGSTDGVSSVSNTTALSVLGHSRPSCRGRRGSRWSGRPASRGRSRRHGRRSRDWLGARVSGGGEDRRAGDGVAGGPAVDVDGDTRVAALVGTWELDGRGGGSACGAGNADLHAAHVELGAGVAACAVQRDELAAEEVVAVGDVGGDLDVPVAGAGVEAVDGPYAAAEALLLDLEPVEGAGGGGGGGVVDLGEVDDDGALVGGGDWVVTVSGALGTVCIISG